MTDLHHDAFPRASAYDAEWLLELDMGPNPLWLLEELLETMPLRPGSRVLDLGCGRGATSVFLAKELGVWVQAVDLWVPAETISEVIRRAGCAEQISVSNADVRALPFADETFDAIVCIDAWEYFGTDDHLLPRLLRVLAPGGLIGIATPAMRRDVRSLGAIPAHIADVVGGEALAWHEARRWLQQWSLTGLVDDVVAREARSGWSDWLRWARAVAERAGDADNPVVDMLRRDAGELLGFALVSARKSSGRK